MDVITTARRPIDVDAPSLIDGGAYQIPAEPLHPETIAAPLLLELPEFAHLREGEAKIDWLLKRDQKMKGGRQVLGTAYMPKVQGELNPCFVWMLARLFGRECDFLIILDQSYWLSAPPKLREILVYHELSHCIQKVDGLGVPRYDENDRPVWGLRGHDVEEFTAVVRRYGAWNSDIQSFVSAIIAHTEETQLQGGIAPVGGARTG